MALTITALLVDTEGKALASRDFMVLVYGLDGLAKTLALGVSGADGKLAVMTKITVTDLQPRLSLRVKVGEKFAAASDAPVAYATASCDFGKVIVDTLITRLPTGDSELDRLRAELTLEKETALSALKHQLTAEWSAALAAQSQQLLADKASALAVQSEQLAADQAAALAAQSEQLAADKAAALAIKDEEIAALKHQLVTLASDAPPESTIEDLAQSAATQIQRVQKTLRDDQAGLTLGKVSLNLRVLPGTTGGRVALPQTRDIQKVGAAALGSLDLAFSSDAGAVRQRTGLTAPRLLGYTEALARRKLAERGLGVEIVSQLVSTAGEHGRVVLQRPQPNTPITEGSVILIAIGRQDEHDPRPT
jgi:hypothetical protein